MLGHAPPYGVVVKPSGLGAGVFGAGAAGGGYLGEIAFIISGKALVGVFAAELADQTTMTIIEETAAALRLHNQFPTNNLFQISI